MRQDAIFDGTIALATLQVDDNIARAGDRRSAPPATIDVALLFRENHAWLCRWAARYAGDADLGEDVAAQAFVELMKVQTVSYPRALLKTIVKRLICDRSRRAKVEERYLAQIGNHPEETCNSAEDVLIVRNSLRMVELVLADLSPNARAAFLYSQIDGLTYAEIGLRLGVSISRVQQYMVSAFRNCARVADL